uniref:PWWP domain-containing protein n=1 Tax=Anopheles melas TaxID=34690 RepID=A0A182U752_9DIPT
MASLVQQETPCGVISAIWNIITSVQGEEIEQTKLVEQLADVLEDTELAERHVQAAISDELIVECARPKHRGRQRLTPTYTVPANWQTYAIPDGQPDKYCYECHQVGSVVKCAGCVRSFHEGCLKTGDERQLELEQYMSKQKRITVSAVKARTARGRQRRSSAASLAVTEESTVSSMDLSAVQGSVEHADSTGLGQHGSADDSVDVIVGESLADRIKHESDDTCSSIKREENVKEEGLPTVDDAMFVGMVRPPNRRLERSLNTPTVKPEVSDREGSAGRNGSDDSSQAASDTIAPRYCYACELLRYSSNQAPSSIEKCELNYLLKFVVEQYKSWIPKDTFSTSKFLRDTVRHTPVVKRKTIDICRKMLLRIPTSFADVREKIASEQYARLEEFHVDLLDIVHNVAIIHGDTSMAYSAAMYFLADCVYDLREIRHCSDCYRHSAEKAEPHWFARPCRTRHELVFAKQSRFQYWPAKVVRVVNNLYDVRFFGGNHPRALIDAGWVKPIDTELGTLGVKDKHGGFQLAMKEMLKYQSLAEGFRDHFGFTSVTEQMQAAVVTRTVESVLPPELREGAGRQSTSLGGEFTARTTKKRQRNQRNKQPSVVHQSVPLGAVSPPPTVTSTNGSTISTRSKRRETASHQHTPAKKTRSSTQAVAQSPEQDSVELPLQQLDCALDGNHNGYDGELKQLFQQVTDLEETKQVALKLLQNKEQHFARKLEWLKETHQHQISEIKKRQWHLGRVRVLQLPDRTLQRIVAGVATSGTGVPIAAEPQHRTHVVLAVPGVEHLLVIDLPLVVLPAQELFHYLTLAKWYGRSSSSPLPSNRAGFVNTLCMYEPMSLKSFHSRMNSELESLIMITSNPCRTRLPMHDFIPGTSGMPRIADAMSIGWKPPWCSSRKTRCMYGIQPQERSMLCTSGGTPPGPSRSRTTTSVLCSQTV